MTNEKAIELLKDIITNKISVHGGNEEAISMAIKALEDKDTNISTKEEAIPVDWIVSYAKRKGKSNLDVSAGAYTLLAEWKGEQKGE